VDALANVANMALTGQVIRRVPRGWVFLYLLALGMAVSLAVTHWRTTWAAAATLGLGAGALAVYYALFFWGSVLFSGAGPAATAIFSFAGVTAFKELVTERSRRKLEKELEKNTSPELVEILMEHPELLRQPRKMTGTFLFSDIKSFTSISEKMTPEVLVPFINRYLDRTTRSLKRHRAYLDKYIGDGIMALFGVPVASEDHARNACLAALDNQALLRELNEEFAREGLPRITTRIGINSGEAIAGYVGAEERSDYTVLGDAVNLASRLEGANKEYETSILVSEFTQRRVAAEFVFRELDRIRVVGKRNAVGIYELVAPAGGSVPMPAGFLEAYAAALALFRGRRWEEAIEAFRRALALRPGDRPSGTYIARAEAFLREPPPEDWEGVFELSSK
jgi:adenylate cyclase